MTLTLPLAPLLEVQAIFQAAVRSADAKLIAQSVEWLREHGGLDSEALSKLCAEAVRSIMNELPPPLHLLADLPEREPNPLTAREIQVLDCVATGLSNPAVGKRLHISASTVKTHLFRAFEKLNCRDRTVAVVIALRKNWISGESGCAGETGADTAAGG